MAVIQASSEEDFARQLMDMMLPDSFPDEVKAVVASKFAEIIQEHGDDLSEEEFMRTLISSMNTPEVRRLMLRNQDALTASTQEMAAKVDPAEVTPERMEEARAQVGRIADILTTVEDDSE